MRRILPILIGLVLAASRAEALTTDALLDTLQHTGFNYFWNEANPANGMIKDRSTSDSPASIAAVGFGLSSICIGVDHGWVTRAAARTRVLATLNTFWTGPQGPETAGTIGYHGLFYHFLTMNTAKRTWICELSTIDTALLFAGILDAKQYFTQDEPTENQIRALADSIYYRADWDWARNGGQGIKMGWLPETGKGFSTFGEWVGYNEAKILYLLALGSPTHAVPDNAWTRWTSGYFYYTTGYGYSYVISPPAATALFLYQYSECWIDFRGRADAYMRAKGLTYFENSRRATLDQQAYAIANPKHWAFYSSVLWGLTASDAPPPIGYTVHGHLPNTSDDGTITPTAAASSIAFAPEIVIPTLHNLYDFWYVYIWGTYGFKDAFNPTIFWFDMDYLGIDEGPIVMMIENYRNGRVWTRFMQNADIQRGLVHAGFTPFSDAVEPPIAAGGALELSSVPNPSFGGTTVRFRIPSSGPVRLAAYDIMGREVARLVDTQLGAGEHTVRFDGGGLAAGVYLLRLDHDGVSVQRRAVRLR